ncbi:RNA-binding protein [Candidatus Peregrinibacteria bacterium RIFOXYB2_FULL_32_7]|nr:MAG: RNA-binding protein [Candidatus Peregrinibacteria bacterium RIFOXYB2_FULL_32_7]
MSKKLFVGNIDWGTTQEELTALFSEYGAIEDCAILKDRETGRSRGFGFVTFTNDADGDNAVSKINGYELKGRALVVNEARPQEERKPKRY